MVGNRQALFSGTETPPAHLSLNVPKLAAYLGDVVTGLGNDFFVEKFKGGQSNPTYRLTSADGARRYVLRRRPPGDLLASAHDIAREYKVMSALHRAQYPVPLCYHFCADETIIGSAFYIVSCAEGTVHWDADLPGASVGMRRDIYSGANALLAQLHQIDYASLGLNDLGKAGGYAARNLGRWSSIYIQSQLVDVPDMNHLITRLPELLPREEQVRLLHGDYGLYNVVIADGDHAIRAVLDWEMATLGDPFIDLAHHLRPWWEPEDTGGAGTSLRRCDLAALGIPDMDSYIALYCRNMQLSELPYRTFYLGFAQFRYAAMIQGILMRAHKGTNANRTVLHTQERVFEVAAMARRTIEGHAP